MGSREQAVMCLESHAVLAGVTKHFVTNFSKTCNKKHYHIHYEKSKIPKS